MAAEKDRVVKKKDHSVHYSSENTEWETPSELFKPLHEEFHFTFDVCASQKNCKCIHYYDKDRDGLSKRWNGTCWMNPPYGREMAAWVEKAYRESRQRDVVVVALLPARTDTVMWHKFVMRATEVRLIQGRVRFVGAAASARFPSCIVVWTKWIEVPKFSSWSY